MISADQQGINGLSALNEAIPSDVKERLGATPHLRYCRIQGILQANVSGLGIPRHPVCILEGRLISPHCIPRPMRPKLLPICEQAIPTSLYLLSIIFMPKLFPTLQFWTLRHRYWLTFPPP